MAESSLRVLALEPYYGGSHRAFLDTWVRASRHAWVLETLPARHWKWRMRGSAIWFAQQLEMRAAGGAATVGEQRGGEETVGERQGGEGPAGESKASRSRVRRADQTRKGVRETDDPVVGEFDALFACDMTSVADLRALLPEGLSRLPIVCYFHENQLTYPLSPTDWRDYQYGFTNITSALAADAVWFNSISHRDAFLEAADGLMRKMSDFVPRDTVDRILAKSSVQYPAVEVPTAPPGPKSDGPLRILWSHRWEYDKNPEAFFNALLSLHDGGADFELILVGEQFRAIPKAFQAAAEKLAPRVAHSGYLESRAEYLAVLGTCDLVVSTAIQENFGLSVVEAMLAGCQPLLPNRLSYPELIPADLRNVCLYNDENELLARLRQFAANPTTTRQVASKLRADLTSRFGTQQQVGRLDAQLADVVAQSRRRPYETGA